MLVQITAPHFCAGIVLNDTGTRVTAYAPILDYMKHWDRSGIRYYCRKRGWIAKIIHQ